MVHTKRPLMSQTIFYRLQERRIPSCTFLLMPSLGWGRQEVVLSLPPLFLFLTLSSLLSPSPLTLRLFSFTEKEGFPLLRSLSVGQGCLSEGRDQGQNSQAVCLMGSSQYDVELIQASSQRDPWLRGEWLNEMLSS